MSSSSSSALSPFSASSSATSTSLKRLSAPIRCFHEILPFSFLDFSGVPVDPLEWQISQETANRIFATLANTVGAAESVLRVAATGHDKRLFWRVVISLYALSVLGRMVSGATIAYAGLCLFCLYMFAESSLPISRRLSQFLGRREGALQRQDSL